MFRYKQGQVATGGSVVYYFSVEITIYHHDFVNEQIELLVYSEALKSYVNKFH